MIKKMKLLLCIMCVIMLGGVSVSAQETPQYEIPRVYDVPQPIEVIPGASLYYDNFLGASLSTGFHNGKLYATVEVSRSTVTTGFTGVLRICGTNGYTIKELGFTDTVVPLSKTIDIDVTSGQQYFIEFYGNIMADGKEDEFVRVSTTTSPAP